MCLIVGDTRIQCPYLNRISSLKNMKTRLLTLKTILAINWEKYDDISRRYWGRIFSDMGDMGQLYGKVDGWVFSLGVVGSITKNHYQLLCVGHKSSPMYLFIRVAPNTPGTSWGNGLWKRQNYPCSTFVTIWFTYNIHGHFRNLNWRYLA